MTISGYKEILDHALDFLKDDYTELWIISTKTKELNPEFSSTEILEATKIVVEDLVTTHGATLVDVNTQRPMSNPTTETLNIISKHLDLLGREPNVGDGLWLSIENDTT